MTPGFLQKRFLGKTAAGEYFALAEKYFFSAEWIRLYDNIFWSRSGYTNRFSRCPGSRSHGNFHGIGEIRVLSRGKPLTASVKRKKGNVEGPPAVRVRIINTTYHGAKAKIQALKSVIHDAARCFGRCRHSTYISQCFHKSSVLSHP